MENKKTNKTNIIFKMLGVIFTLFSIVFLAYLAKFNMLPKKYIVITSIVLGLMCASSLFILINKKSRVILKIITSVILIGLMFVYGFGISYINTTMVFIDDITTVVEETEDYYIVTLNDGEYTLLNDLNGKIIYTFMADEDYTDIKEEIIENTNVIFKDVTSIKELAQSILDEKLEAILISNSQYEMLCDEFEDFEAKIIKLHTLIHKFKKVEQEFEDKNTQKKHDRKRSF